MSARATSENPDRLGTELHDRRALLDRTSETYVALADRLDDEIAALEAAQRLATPASDVEFDPLLDQAERDSSEA